jgi:hypothetical protein
MVTNRDEVEVACDWAQLSTIFVEPTFSSVPMDGRGNRRFCSSHAGGALPASFGRTHLAASLAKRPFWLKLSLMQKSGGIAARHGSSARGAPSVATPAGSGWNRGAVKWLTPSLDFDEPGTSKRARPGCALTALSTLHRARAEYASVGCKCGFPALWSIFAAFCSAR